MENRYHLACSLFVLAGLLLFSLAGCGTNPTGGGSSPPPPVPPPFSADIWVSTTGSDETGDGSQTSPFRTIQKGLDTATTGKVVGVLNGTYETSGITWPLTAEGITLRGQSRDGTRIVNNNDSLQPTLTISNLIASTQAITIEGFTFTGANRPAVEGGSISCDFTNSNGITLNIESCLFDGNIAKAASALYCYYSSSVSCLLNVSDTVFSGNRSVGAAVYNVYGAAVGIIDSAPGIVPEGNTGTFTNCTFEGNYVGNTTYNSWGGALYSKHDLNIYGCAFLNNTAECTSTGQGGAVYSLGTLTVEGSVFSGNSTRTTGGALTHSSIRRVTIKGCTFSDNRSSNHTGAVYVQGDEILISGCVFKRNYSGSDQGALNIYDGGRIENCLFWGNAAGSQYGAITQTKNNLEIVNCTIVSNEAPTSPGLFLADYLGTRTTNIRNCIVWGNTGSGGQINYVASTPEVEYSDVGGGYTGTGNVDMDPGFVNYPPDVDTDLKLDGSVTEVTAGGSYEVAPDDDIEGYPRSGPDHVSMGAYEYH